MNLSSVDLNLLVVLEALLTTQSTTLAARRLALSQPATSHALARLRELVGDPLLVREGRGLAPTPYAELLLPRVTLALDAVRGAIARPAPFDRATSTRLFAIGAGDYAASVLVPPLAARFGREAPNVDLFAKPPNEPTPAALARGEYELALEPPASDSPSVGESFVRSEILFRERFLCLVRPGHPLGRSRLTLDRYCAYGHVLVAPRGSSREGAVDAALARLGRRRRVAVAIASFFVAPSVVVDTDYVLTIASRVGKRLANELGLRVLEPPIELEGFAIAMKWHARHDADKGHAYLRESVRAVAKRVARA